MYIKTCICALDRFINVVHSLSLFWFYTQENIKYKAAILQNYIANWIFICMYVMGCVFKHVWGEHVCVDQRDRESSYLKI